MRLALSLMLVAAFTLSACCKDAPKDTPKPSPTAEAAEAPAPTSLPAPKGAKVFFEGLKSGDTVTSPLKVCMGVEGIEIEPSGPVNPGKGHHHILVDIPVPDDLSKDIPKDAQNIHMGDGSTCKEIIKPGNL